MSHRSSVSSRRTRVLLAAATSTAVPMLAGPALAGPALAAPAAASGATMVGASTAGPTTLTVFDPETGEQQVVELGDIAVRRAPRGQYVVVVGETDTVLVDTSDASVTHLVGTSQLNTILPFDWLPSTGAPLLGLNAITDEAAPGVVVDPVTGRSWPTNGAFVATSSLVSADAATTSLLTVGVDKVFDVDSGTVILEGTRVVGLSNEIVVSNLDGVTTAVSIDDTATVVELPEVVFHVVPVGERVVFVTADGTVKQQTLDDAPATTVGTLDAADRADEPELLSLANGNVVIDGATATYLVDPAAATVTSIGGEGQFLAVGLQRLAGRSDVAWNCIPLAGDESISFVDAATGTVVGEARFDWLGDPSLRVGLELAVADDGCAIAGTLTAASVVGEQWFVAGGASSATGEGRLLGFASDGSAALIEQDDEFAVLGLGDPGNPEDDGPITSTFVTADTVLSDTAAVVDVARHWR